MPRSNRRRRDDVPLNVARLTGGGVRQEVHSDGAWHVRYVRARDDARSYLCPGCLQQVGADVPHVVAWPADGVGGLADRRHWHTRCWEARRRRPPKGAYR